MQLQGHPASDRAATAARLRLAVMRLARRLRQQSTADATPSMLSALSVIEIAGPMTLGELAALERVRPPTMTRVVARLEEDGLVARDVDDADRRVAHVSLTRAGRELVKRNRSRKDLYLAARLRRLDVSQVETLRAAVEVIEQLLEEDDQ